MAACRGLCTAEHHDRHCTCGVCNACVYKSDQGHRRCAGDTTSLVGLHRVILLDLGSGSMAYPINAWKVKQTAESELSERAFEKGKRASLMISNGYARTIDVYRYANESRQTGPPTNYGYLSPPPEVRGMMQILG